MRKLTNYYQRYSIGNYNNSSLELKESKIKSDFNLILILLFNLILYFILIIPNLFFGLFMLIFNFERSKIYFKRVFIWPFEILDRIFKWFFSAKYTAFLVIFIWIIFAIEFLYIIPNGYWQYFSYSFYNFYSNDINLRFSILFSMFLHNSISHIISNSLALIVFGRIVEKYFSFSTLIIFYFGAIIADLISGYLYFLQSNTMTSVGASAGITALIIVAIFLEPFSLSSFPFLIPIPIFVLGWISIFSDLIGFFKNDTGSNIAYLAHIGGYIALVFLFFFFSFRNRKKILNGLILNLTLFILFYIFLRISGLSLI